MNGRPLASGCAPRADSVLLACNELQPTRRRLRRIHHSSDRKIPHWRATSDRSGASKATARPGVRWLKCAIESSGYSSPDQAGTSSRTSGRKMCGSCVRCRPSAHPRRGSFACTATAVALTGHRGRGRQSRAIASAGVTYVHRPPATRKEWSAPIARRLDSAVNTSAPVRIEVRRSLVRVRPPCIPAGATSSRSQRHCNGVSPWGWAGSASPPSSGSSRKNSPARTHGWPPWRSGFGAEPASRSSVEASARTITTHSFPGTSCRRRGLGRGENFGGTP